MKLTKLFLLAIMAITLAIPAANAQQRQMPREYGGGTIGSSTSSGTSISDLPQPALKFLSNYYNGVNVTKVKREHVPGPFEVTMADGSEIEFDTAGRILEIEAPDNAILRPRLVRYLIGRKMYDELRSNRQTDKVESVDFNYRDGRLIKVATASVPPQKLVFDLKGNLVLIKVDD